MNAQTILRRLHRHLFLPTAIGVPIVSSLSILLAISLITSFVVYKKWWRGFFKPIRWRDARTAWGDVHRLAGLWSMWFVALMMLTGAWYLVESTGGRAPNHPRVAVAPVDLDAEQTASALLKALGTVVRDHPGLRIERILYPTEKSGTFQFHTKGKAILVRPRSDAIWISASDSSVRLLTDGRELNIHQRISEAADPLHFGYFGGVFTKVVWFVFGVGLTALSLSGGAIYSLRILKAERRPTGLQAVIAKAFDGAGLWAWIAVLLVATGLIMTTLGWISAG